MADSDTASAAGGKKSFWETLPGVLTGVAAVLTALGGLIAVLHKPQADSAPVASESSAPAEGRSGLAKTKRRPLRDAAAQNLPVEGIQIAGVWRDLNFGTQVRMRQAGDRVYTETYDPATGQRVAVGTGQIAGRRIAGPYQWMDGTRYLASLILSEDGQEITGTTRNLLTGESLPVHLIR